MFKLNDYVYVGTLKGVHRISNIGVNGVVLVTPCLPNQPYELLGVNESQLRLVPKKEKATHTKRESMYINQIVKYQQAAHRRKRAMRYDADRIRKCKDFMEAALGYRPKDLLTGVRDLIMMGGRNEAHIAADPITVFYESLDDATGQR